MAFAIIFDSVGAGEWLVLLAVLLVVMGPKRLPSTARTIGSYYSKFRRAAESFKRQLLEMDTEFDNAVSSAAHEAEEAFSYDDVGSSADEPPAGEPPEQEHGPQEPASDETPAG